MNNQNSWVKKKLYIFSFLLILSASNILSQSGWFQIPSPTNRFIYTAYFINNDTGFIGTDTGKVYKTYNGGINWVLINVPTSKSIGKIFFVSAEVGYLICSSMGGNNPIFKSTNAGFNWSQMNLPYFTDSRDIYFMNLTTGFVANFGNILKTTNGGTTWDTSMAEIPWSGHMILYYGVSFVNNDTGFVVGNDQIPGIMTTRVIWKTTNRGNNWVRVNSLFDGEYIRVSFMNKEVGYAVGGNKKISKTIDGGNTWQEVNLNLPVGTANLGSVFVVNQNRVFTCGRFGLYSTFNGGINWTLIQIPNEHYGSIFFADSSIGYVVGDLGRIYKTTNGGLPVGISTISDLIPQSPSLHQNYPNPFNPVTKIKFDIPQRHLPLQGGDREGVLLKIYDLLGREVTTLVKEQLKPGSYEVDWDGTGFASGVYFYSLVTESFVETKRMVLIK